ncbi:MAG: Zn-ribbon domain-containing OB-fold protein [Dehalococcoidia bacterium]
MDTLPIPFVTEDAAPFWAGCGRGEFLVQMCVECRKPQWFPRARCRYCHGWNMEWRADRGEGSIYSFTTVRRAADPAFSMMIPYVIAFIDMDAGFRMVSHVVNADPETLAVGQRVRVTFREQEGFKLPVFVAGR